MKKTAAKLTLLIICYFYVMSSLMACTNPVYMYAFDHWRPDYYDAVIMYKGSLSDSQVKTIDILNEAISAGKLNIRLQTIDIESDSARNKYHLKEDNTVEYPRLSLWFPKEMGNTSPFWSVKLSEENIKAIIQSPARISLINDLQRGVPSVWIFIPSGKKETDQKALSTLQREIKLANDSLKKDMQNESKTAVFVPLSIITLAKDKPAEAYTLCMLLNALGGIENTSGPKVLPVFGRGRLLCKVQDQMIQKEIIQSLCKFVTGPCACQVKESNPGMDLLLYSDWQNSFTNHLPAEVKPKLTGVLPKIQISKTGVVNSNPGKDSGLTKASSVNTNADSSLQKASGLHNEKNYFTSKIFSTTALIVGLLFIVVIIVSVIIIKRR
jgi:hypothetical protein